MAKIVFSYLFLVILFSSSNLTIHARESKFFSKITHLGTITIKPRNAIKPSLSPIEAPSPSPALSPFAAELAPSPAETLTPAPAPGTENERSNLFPSKKEENEIFDEEFDGENYQYKNNYKNQNSYAAKNYNNHGYKLASEDHETANQNNYNGFTGNGYDEELARGNGYTTGNQNDKYYNYYNNNGYESNQRQGMSDTRYVAGGRYYSSSNAKKTDYPGTEAGRVINTQNQGYYGNFENQNKYYNNMEYENQELYNENQEEEFLP